MLLKVDGLRKSYGRRLVLDGPVFDADFGEVVGLVGPRGAGKTTLLRMICGLLEPDEGEARVFAIDPARTRRRALERIGYVAQGAPFYPEMTVWSALRFVADVRGLAPEAARSAVRRVAREAALGDAIARPVGTLAEGVRRRAAIAAALVHDPLLLLLDEPTEGLDPQQREGVFALIRAVAAERLVLIASRRPAEIAPLCTRLLVLQKGWIVADGAPDEIAARDPAGLDAAVQALTGPEATAA